MIIFGKLNGRVVTVESYVFDESSLTEEQKVQGYSVGAAPQETPVAGKVVSATYYDLDTKTYSFDYIDKPITTDDKVAQLESQNAQMLLALVNGGLI